MKKIKCLRLFSALILLLMPGPATASMVADKIEGPVGQALVIEQKTQFVEVEWRGEKEKKTRVFQEMEKEVAALEAEFAEQATRNRTLKKKMETMESQLADIQQISDQMSPFLDQTLDRIKGLQARDLPFLKQERKARLSSLLTLNADPDAGVSEKYRKIMEALLVEAEYGRTVEVSQQTIDLAGEKTLVNIFRLGRMSLFYQTLDRQCCGFYNSAKKSWAPLDRAFLKDIQAAVDMGTKRKPVEIIDLPLGRILTQ